MSRPGASHARQRVVADRELSLRGGSFVVRRVAASPTASTAVSAAVRSPDAPWTAAAVRSTKLGAGRASAGSDGVACLLVTETTTGGS